MEIPVKKNETYIVDIIDQGYEGEGIAKIDGYTIFIPGAIKKEKCKILILKTTKSHAFGKVLEIINSSKDRVETECLTYQKCGGCSLRHMNYDATLNIKREIVQNLVDKTLENKIKVKKAIGMNEPYHYRNKAQYPIGYDKQGNITTGVFANRTHDIIPMQVCKIQHPISEYIAKLLVSFLQANHIPAYQEKTTQGIFRHVVVKIGKKTKEVMCVFVVNQKIIPKEKELVDYLLQNFKKEYPEYVLKTIIKNINPKNTNVILGNQNIVLYGDGYIYDKLGDYTFKISPMSFYQVNPVQTGILYNEAIKGANIQKEDVVLDLYCGIGTIGIYASAFAKKVYGIEIVEQAIEDAKENAKENSIENIEFICGDVEPTLADLLNNRKVQPNVIFVDPPRRGLDNVTIQNILKVQPQKVVYISCNPATMVRDLKQLEGRYEIKGIQPVDMFPFTSHVETIAVLCLKETTAP
ncbi:MAG: 23S rRNA (uracil(1939)-C(5))-methyltransferase RlmD [Clostridia bacterium]|nr:23S rRNA (uracil(1939)-C(5))-methyltransferase RlmD [Clostridia bacterium]